MKPYLEYELLVRNLFGLVAQGKADSQEAKDIRSKLLELEPRISEKNRERVLQLAKRLYNGNRNNAGRASDNSGKTQDDSGRDGSATS